MFICFVVNFYSNKAVEVDCCLRKYILGKIIKGSPNGLFHMVYLGRPMAEIRQDFEKWFSVSRKGVKNEAFPI